MNTTRNQLGLPENAPKFDILNFSVSSDFSLSGDMFKSTSNYVSQLLERGELESWSVRKKIPLISLLGVRVLIYAGKTDSSWCIIHIYHTVFSSLLTLVTVHGRETYGG